MKLATRYSLLALIALVSLITPKFATAQSYQVYQQCASGSGTVYLPNGSTVVGANTYCWYVYGPGNSNGWTPPNTTPPGGGGTTPPPAAPPVSQVPENNGCTVGFGQINCAITLAEQCWSVNEQTVIASVRPTRTDREYLVFVEAVGGTNTWIIGDNGNGFDAQRLDQNCSGNIP